MSDSLLPHGLQHARLSITAVKAMTTSESWKYCEQCYADEADSLNEKGVFLRDKS